MRRLEGRWLVAAVAITAAVAGFSVGATASPGAAEAAPARAAAQPAAKGKLAIVSNTGLEDIGTLASSFKHARIALQSGHLESVVWLSYGRSIAVLDPTVKAVPELVLKEMEEARAAGVEFAACNNALNSNGIDPKSIPPYVKVVKAGAAEMARLVAEGYEVIRY